MLVLLVLGCPGLGTGVPAIDSVPAVPTWEADVGPLLAERCTGCHTVPQQGGAPDYFRLDRYAEEGGYLGAYEQKELIILRAVYSDPYQMPLLPLDPLDATEKAVLEAWVEAGAPEHAEDTGA
jgi:hypothetical protein